MRWLILRSYGTHSEFFPELLQKNHPHLRHFAVQPLSPKVLGSTLYTTGLITLAALAKAETPLSAAELAARTGISAATIRQKMKGLEALGLATIQKAGRRQVVSLVAGWRDFFGCALAE